METRTIYRSSITGRIITKEEAEANPDTTQAETLTPLCSKRVKESLSYLLDTLANSPQTTDEDRSDIEQLKGLL